MNDITNVFAEYRGELKKYYRALPLLTLCFFAYHLVDLVADRYIQSIFFITNIFFSLVRWEIMIIMYGHLASVLTTLFQRGRLRPSDLASYDMSMQPSIQSVFFVFWCVELIFSWSWPAAMSTFISLAYRAWKLYTAFAFEAIYMDGENASTIFPCLNNLWKNNSLVMCFTSALILAAYYGFFGRLQVYSYFFDWKGILAQLLIALLYAFYFLSLSILYVIIGHSNPRARAFRREAGGR